jgi:hypothetical protein
MYIIGKPAIQTVFIIFTFDVGDAHVLYMNGNVTVQHSGYY